MLSLRDTQKEIDFSVVNKFYLLSADEDTRIRVDPNVINFPSLKKRCQLTDDVCYIKLDTNDTNVICGIANLCCKYYDFEDRMGDIISFIQYICDDELMNRFLADMGKIVIEGSESCDTPEETRVEDFIEVEGTDIKFLPFYDSVVKSINPTPVFKETLTPEQCEKLPISYLLTHYDRCKYAFSHPNIGNADLTDLGCAIIRMWNKELEFVTTGKGHIKLFTNEFENLPRFNVKVNEESPYKLRFDKTNITLGEETHYKPVSYSCLINRIKSLVSYNDVVKRFMVEGYGIIFGDSLSSLTFQTSYYSPLTLCLKDKSKLKDALTLFSDYKRKDHLDKQLIIFKCSSTRTIHLYIPNISHIHHIASQPYSINRMFFDGDKVRMTLSCMLSWINNEFVTIYPWKCDADKVTELLRAGFNFYTKDIEDLLGDSIRMFKQTHMTKYRYPNYFRGFDDDEGYLLSKVYTNEFA